MKEQVKIVFAADKSYLVPLTVAVLSLMKNNRGLELSITVISGDINTNDFLTLKNVVCEHGMEIELMRIDDDVFNHLVISNHFQKSNYYRLLIPRLIDNDTVLYLDCDIVVNGPIKDLLDINLGNNLISAVENPGFTRHTQLKMSPEARYFNSGVMLINNKKWKEDKVSERVISFVAENPDVVEFVDQCGLNAVINGNWKKIELKYNQQSVIFTQKFKDFLNVFSSNELDEARSNPIIIHYTGSTKPWHYLSTHPYKDTYWRYLKMSPYMGHKQQGITLGNIIKKIFKH